MEIIRKIPASKIERAVQELLEISACQLPADYLDALRHARTHEPSERGRAIISMLLDNAEFAQSEGIPTCQDTGMVILHLTIGQNVHITGDTLSNTLNKAVKTAYQRLRKSVVSDPLLRQNTGDYTPPLIHYEIVDGDQIQITALMKGFGAELMSALKMFPPSAGINGIKQFVRETVEQAGPNACPPVIVGVGLGSSFDGVALLAKKALMRPLNQPNPIPHLAQLEQELLADINQTGIGPQGFGGHFTALAVHIESFATHIAALPVAVNLNCSAPRRATIII